MPPNPATSGKQTLSAENADLRARLDEAEDMLRAIRAGEVDALVVESSTGPHVFALQGLDAESNRFRGEILGQISDAVIALDDDGQVTYINASAERQYGVTASEVLGRHLTDIYLPRWPRPEDEAEVMAVVRETGLWQGEHMHVKRDGEVIHVDCSLTALRAANGNRSGMLAVIRDITSRKQAEDALRESETKFRSLFENSLDAIFLTVSDGKVLAANRTACAMFGMSEAELCRIGRSGIMNHADPRHALALAERASTGIINSELTYVRKDGTIFPAEVQSVILDDVSQQSFIVMRDITERKRAEEALRENQQLLQDVIDGSPSPIFLKDSDGKFLTINTSLEKMLGMSREELKGKTDYDIAPKEVADSWRANDKQVMETGKGIQSEEVADLPDGHHIFLANKFPLVDANGQIYGVGAISHDITERRQAEEGLRRSEERLRLALQAARMATWDWDILTNQVIWNDEHYRMLGYEPQGVQPSYEAWAQLMHPDDRAKTEALFQCAMEQGNDYSAEFRIVRPDGTERWLEARGQYERDASGRPVRSYGVMIDFTQRKQAEVALAETEERLSSVMENMSDGIMVFDPQGNCIYQNAASLRIQRYSSAEDARFHLENLLRGAFKGWDITGHPLSYEEWPGVRVCRQEHFQNQVLHVLRVDTGHEWFASYNGYPIFGADGKMTLGFITIRDITEQVRAEEESRKLQELVAQERDRLSALVNSITDEIWFADTEGKFTLVNPSGNREFALETVSVSDVRELAGELEVFRLDGSPRMIEEAPPLRALRGEVVQNQEEIVRTPASGELRYRQVSSSPVKDSLGNIIGSVSVVRDITQRRQAEEALRESEERYRSLFEHMLDGFAYCRVLYENGSPQDFIYLDVNDAFVQLTGLQNVIGKRVSEVIPGIHQSNPELLEIYGRVALTGNPERFETYLQPLGSWFSVAVYSPVKEHFVAVFDNITERKKAEEALHKRAEEALRMSEEEFHSLAEAMPQIVWATRPDGWNIYFNQKWVDYTGMTLEESYGHGWNLPFHPEDKQRAWDAWQRATQHLERYSLECRLRRHDGVYRWWLIRGEPMRGADGEILKWFGTCTDIEDMKWTEAALQEANDLLERRVAERTTSLRESERRFRLALKNSPVSVAIQDRNQVYQWAYNQKSRRPDEIIGKTDADLFSPEDVVWINEVKQRVLDTGNEVHVEHWVTSNGQRLFLDLTLEPLRDAAGQVTGIGIAVVNLTKQKLAEEQIKASLEEKEVLLKEIHHRVKNNLQVISSLVSLQADSLADDGLSTVFGDIGDRIQTIALIHEKIYQTETLARLDFADYASSLLNYLWQAHGTLAGKVRLVQALALVVMPVESAVTCGLILNELASNALKHAFPNGKGGAVTVGLDKDPVTDTLCLWVRDNGIGLPEGLEWRQANTLGLRLVRLLAGQLGGTLAPGPGPGTEFRVTFIQKGSQS